MIRMTLNQIKCVKGEEPITVMNASLHHAISNVWFHFYADLITSICLNSRQPGCGERRASPHADVFLLFQCDWTVKLNKSAGGGGRVGSESDEDRKVGQGGREEARG